MKFQLYIPLYHTVYVNSPFYIISLIQNKILAVFSIDSEEDFLSLVNMLFFADSLAGWLVGWQAGWPEFMLTK